ncbi:hypothetical protein V5E97_08755 [Singulisphaera sp. Ch08]|uniref:Uncharacterized protein n=1 Tax=Singulisphaera sp. Ch08 TaxID=3120278 RepID=A0AAU7CL25_9BACT
MNARYCIAVALLAGTSVLSFALRDVGAQSPETSGQTREANGADVKLRSERSAEEVARLRSEYAKNGPPSPAQVVKLRAIQDKRLKEALELAKVGRYPVVRYGPTFQRPRTTVIAPVENRGTKIVPDADATGEMLILQKDFAVAIAKGDPQPPDRTNHFLWLNNTDAFKEGNARVVGWYGAVVDVKQADKGSWLIQIVIRPWIESPGRGILFDKVLETYEFSNGQIKLVDSDAHLVTERGQQVFPGAR